MERQLILSAKEMYYLTRGIKKLEQENLNDGNRKMLEILCKKLTKAMNRK